MHLSSIVHMTQFFKKYLKDGEKVLEIGSRSPVEHPCMDYRGLPESFLPRIKNVNYIGLDIEAGYEVDLVVQDPYEWKEIADETFDIVISGQTFEHIEFFWLTFSEMVRVLKTGGYMCIIAPKIQKQHRYPVDCWRFMPDSMKALAKWGEVKCIMIAAHGVSFNRPITKTRDCVGIFRK